MIQKLSNSLIDKLSQLKKSFINQSNLITKNTLKTNESRLYKTRQLVRNRRRI